MRLLIFLSFPILLFAGMETPFNSDFINSKYEKFDLIYPKEYEKYSDMIAKKVERTITVYEKSFGYKLNNRLKIILASTNDQILNGYSTPIYTNKIVLFNGGSAGVEYFASPFWIDTLINHELAHTFQMNAQKSWFSRFANNIFGNSLLAPIIQIFPNILLPNAMLEGNAVLNETFFQVGGRLYNGSLKAKFLAIYKDMTLKKFLNNHLDFPFLEEKYIVGSYFNLYLSKQFGINRVNQFFLEHSGKFIQNQAIFLNSTFNNHFGKNLEELFTDFLESWQISANRFQKLQGEEIGFSEIYYPLTRNKQNIFITSSENDSKPETKIFDKKSQIFLEKSYFGTGGRIFQIENEIIEAKSDAINPQKIGYALWKNGTPLENTQDKIYLDYNNGDWLYFDLDSSLETAKLYKNNEFIDEVSSSAIFDDNNSIYYFRQDGDFRQLMIGKDYELFRFQGYFSKIVDVYKKDVYFIANSEFGSTLYVMRDGGLYRVSNADNIVDGKLIDSKTMLLTSVESDGFHYYTFNISDNLDNQELWITNEFQPNLNADYFKFFPVKNLKKVSESKYNSFTDLSFAELTWFSDSQFFEKLNFLFKDSIGFNSLNLTFQDLDYEQRYSFLYSNFRYWINYGFSAELTDSKNQDSEKYSSFLNFKLSETENWSSNLRLDAIYDNQNSETLDFVSSYYFGMSEQYGYSILPTNKIYISPFYKYSDEVNSAGFYTGFGKEIFSKTFFNASYQGLFSFKQTDILRVELSEDVDDVADIYLDGLKNYVLPSKNIHKFTTSILTTFQTPIYFETFPLGLRRISPFLTYNYLLQDRESGMKYIDEKIVGFKFDILFARKLSFPLDITYIENLLSGSSINFEVGVKF